MTLVYLIEDDPTMANVLSISIRQAGQLQPDGTIAAPRVDIFHDAVSAIEAVNERVPDVILLDILLTGPDGFTFLNELRSYPDTIETPVILISSLNLTNERLAPYGITKILDKATMTPEDIQIAIAEALAKTAITALERQKAQIAQNTQNTQNTQSSSVIPDLPLANQSAPEVSVVIESAVENQNPNPNSIPEAETVDPTVLPAVAPIIERPTVENNSGLSRLNDLLASNPVPDDSPTQEPNAF